MDEIEHATIWARKAHEGQVRKYTGDPYFDTHCKNVANLVRLECDKRNIKGQKKTDMIVAALLHDTIEDTQVTEMDVYDNFGNKVFEMVYELTDHFTPENYPHLNREKRKKLECDRLAACRYAVRLIKYCDIMDNTSSIENADDGFKYVYLPEKNRLLKALDIK